MGLLEKQEADKAFADVGCIILIFFFLADMLQMNLDLVNSNLAKNLNL